VAQWVDWNRGACQVPILLGGDKRAEDMELVRQEKSTAADVPTPPALNDLDALWAQRDALAKGFPPPWATAPHLWRQYQDSLVRYENLVRAGAEPPSARKELGTLHDRVAQAG